VQPEPKVELEERLFFVLKVTEIDIAEFEDREIYDWFCNMQIPQNSAGYGTKIAWYVIFHTHPLSTRTFLICTNNLLRTSQ
jgi:hypothetical protein